MLTLTAVVDTVGPSLLRVVVPGGSGQVDDVTLAEPDDAFAGRPGDLVLIVSAAGAAHSADVVDRCGQGGAAGVVLKPPLATDAAVREAAARRGIAVVELQRNASWSHLVWLLRGVIDAAAAPGSPVLGEPGVTSDLFALADAAAAIVGAPVTIEDPQSRVLAYSALQEGTDPARVSTIVGRRVPDPVLAHFRSRGVFRRLARSSEPILVPAGPDGTLPRLIIPVRAGGEWLGSIWAVVAGPVPDEQVRELTGAASVLALHLLRLRAQAGVARRLSADRLRALLRGTGPPGPEVWLPPGPWRVVALGPASGEDDAQRRLDLWESISRRHGWRQPLLTEVDGVPFVLVTADGSRRSAGCWAWLREVAGRVGDDPSLLAAAGSPAAAVADLPRSRAAAAELASLVVRGVVPGRAVAAEEAWDAVVVHRAASHLASGAPTGGPLQELVDQDANAGTQYLPTLAAWLAHPGDPRGAASALHVHPNTLRYRMRRLSEVVDVDLSSPRIRLALQLQLAALGAVPS